MPMMFCPECKSMLESYDGKLRCPKCGYEDFIPVDGYKEKNVTLPTIEIKCPKCGYELAECSLRQLRDGSEVRFFSCLKCGQIWRECD